MYPAYVARDGRTTNPAGARRVSPFGDAGASDGRQTTERALAAARRLYGLDHQRQSPPGSPSWRRGLARVAPASPSWALATPMPHHDSPVVAFSPHQRPMRQDPDAVKAAVDAYMTSPTYDRFVESLCADASRAIDERLRDLAQTGTDTTGGRVRRGSRDLFDLAHARAPVPLAIFDVDDTLLSSHPGRRLRFAANLLASGVRMPSAYLPPLDPVVRLYRSLRDRGVRTAILTGRRSNNETVTLDNLRWAGIDGWDHAIFRAVGTPEQHMDAVDYKSRQRARLAAAGYEIVANVGDQHSDLHGGNSGVAVKLPNPMHTIA